MADKIRDAEFRHPDLAAFLQGLMDEQASALGPLSVERVGVASAVLARGRQGALPRVRGGRPAGRPRRWRRCMRSLRRRSAVRFLG